MVELTQQLLNGLVIGSFYVLIAMGLSIIYGILEIPHFAHGSVAVIGGYFSYILTSQYNLHLLLSIVISMIFAALVGILLERIAYRPVKNAPPINAFIIALGLMMVIDNGLTIIFSPDQIIIPSEYNQVYSFLGVSITNLRLYLLFSSILLILFLYLFINRTKTGKAIRAVAQNREASTIVGINTNRITSIVFGLGSALAASAGVFMGVLFSLYPTMGGHSVMKGFAVIILGGLGSFPGTIIGGMLIGITESLGSSIFSSSYKDIFAFLIMITILMFKPQGLFGSKG
ncbi:branched-chain amino acid ABC transporter permease [Bacillus sp. JJ1533]|uniref:branched-chain amino acid ABC transporter permease n=1 Tax=Bacillus sp. JJ1533 TaxID=3122959 RepID=UPI002FFE45DF